MATPARTASALVTPLRARIYARASLKRDGKVPSPPRQIEQCRALIAARGWIEAGEPIVDDGRSASDQRETTRPGYLAFVDSMGRGEFDIPVGHADDRFWRTISEREAFMWVASDAGVPFVATCTSDYKVGDPDDEFRGELGVMLAKHETRRLARRMRSKHVQKAKDGEWPGGPAPFGYELDKANKTLKVDPARAAAIDEIVRRLLAGETTVAVVRDFAAAGWVTLGKGYGNVAAMARLVLSPTLAGLRVRNGEKIPGGWPAIISVADHERLCAIFDARKRGPRPSNASANVLAGLVVCGLCGSNLTVSTSHGRTRYRCPPEVNGGCGGLSIPKLAAEAVAVDLVAAELDDPDFRRAVDLAAAAEPASDLADVAAGLAADRVQLGAMADAFADGDMTRDAYRRAVARLDARIAEAEAVLARAASTAGPAVALLGRGSEVRETFARPEGEGGPSFSERREILRRIAARFVAHPAAMGNRGGPRFDPARLTMVSRFAH